MRTRTQTVPDHFVLSQRCSVGKGWVDLPGDYPSPVHAEAAATERGNSRVVYVSEGGGPAWSVSGGLVAETSGHLP